MTNEPDDDIASGRMSAEAMARRAAAEEAGVRLQAQFMNEVPKPHVLLTGFVSTLLMHQTSELFLVPEEEMKTRAEALAKFASFLAEETYAAGTVLQGKHGMPEIGGPG